jgi:signal transduction histidine kinase
MNSTLIQELTTETPLVVDEASGQDRRLLEGYLHKTSNTLCGIKGYASLIADREFTGDEAGQWARKIIAEVERMEDIFRSVGDLTRGRGNPDIGVDLCRLVADVVEGFANRTSGIDLHLREIPEGELRLPATDLSLLVNEILLNSSESGSLLEQEIVISVGGERTEDGRVFLTIRDNGCGMEPELLRQAPDPFVTTKDEHHGVGLTRVATLMDMYGLAWDIRSAEGKGTLVTIEVAEAL